MAFYNPDDPVAKGAVTRCLDEISIGANARTRMNALHDAIAALAPNKFDGLATVFAQYLFPGCLNPGQINKITEYLKTYWFNEATGLWPAFQPIAPIYASGLLQTLNMSLAPSGDPLPIDSYWVLDHTQVQLINLASARQVTLLIATPTPTVIAPSGLWSESAQAWVTVRRAGTTKPEINPVTNTIVSEGTTEPRVRTFKIQPHT